MGFDLLKGRYNSCKNFNIIHDALVVGNVGAFPYFSLHDGYLFKGTHLCLPKKIPLRVSDMGIALWNNN